MITNEAIEKFLKNNPAMTTDEAKQAIADAEAQSILATADERTRFLTNVNGGRDDAQQHAPGEIDAEALDSLVQEADDKKGDNSAGMDKAAVFRKIRKAHAKPNFAEAQKAEKAQGEGLDLGIQFYLRKGDEAYYYKYGENGDEGEPLLFQGITYIAARTGGGKTRCECAFAAQTLYKYANTPTPKHVVFFSLEEPAKDILKHIVTAYINLKYQALDPTADDDKEKPITEDDTTAALLDKLTDNDKKNKIAEGYSDLAELLTVIDSTTFEDAKKNAAEGDNNLNKDTLSAIFADVAGDIETLILDAVAEYGAENVVFMIDYAQMIRDPEGAKSAASYKELQAVAQHLKNAAQRNAILFVGAQVDRAAVRTANAQRNGNPRAYEFHTMARENLREAADLEQSGTRIIYLTIDDKSMVDDKGNPVSYLNFRLLKNRKGSEHLYASAPIYFKQWIIDFGKLTAPTFGDLNGEHGQFVDNNGIIIRDDEPPRNTTPSVADTQKETFETDAEYMKRTGLPAQTRRR